MLSLWIITLDLPNVCQNVFRFCLLLKYFRPTGIRSHSKGGTSWFREMGEAHRSKVMGPQQLYMDRNR